MDPRFREGDKVLATRHFASSRLGANHSSQPPTKIPKKPATPKLTRVSPQNAFLHTPESPIMP